jgi:hypothetical protein
VDALALAAPEPLGLFGLEGGDRIDRRQGGMHAHGWNIGGTLWDW